MRNWLLTSSSSLRLFAIWMHSEPIICLSAKSYGCLDPLSPSKWHEWLRSWDLRLCSLVNRWFKRYSISQRRASFSITFIRRKRKLFRRESATKCPDKSYWHTSENFIRQQVVSIGIFQWQIMTPTNKATFGINISVFLRPLFSREPFTHSWSDPPFGWLPQDSWSSLAVCLIHRRLMDPQKWIQKNKPIIAMVHFRSHGGKSTIVWKFQWKLTVNRVTQNWVELVGVVFTTICSRLWLQPVVLQDGKKLTEQISLRKIWKKTTQGVVLRSFV